VAKDVSGPNVDTTQAGVFVGNPKYMSPDHLGQLDEGESLDGRADLYSLGVVLYEMLTGVPPFVADTPHAYLLKHASERPKSIAETNPAAIAAPELEALIFRALEKDRNKRYASAREFAQALDRIAAGLPDTPGAPPPVPVELEAVTQKTNVNRPQVVTVAATKESATATVASSRPAAMVTLDRVSSGEATVENAEEPKRRIPWVLYAAALVLGLIAVALWTLKKPKPDDVVTTTQSTRSVEASTMTATTTVAAIEPIPSAPGHLGINAYPWANVTSVRNLDNGESVDIGPNVVTPAALDLAPGRYEVTLSNPDYPRPITRRVTLAAGADAPLWVNFTDGRSASVPDFGGAQ
ncbi:MAG TPA: hypothetical protein VNI54_12385, partial [Thermoanaerobaculia bacterium]|nr:hypothetical protein [Thermoanaerobaculia bacterium]